MSDTPLAFANGRLIAQVSALGAELTRLADAEGRDYLWNGDPQWWSGRSPLLFPIVGRAAGDKILIGGKDYTLPQHGFARRSRFAVIEAGPARCVMRLEDSAETRAAYPFAFRLDVAYELRDATLAIISTVSNTGETEMPFAFGYHPAFRWPLPGAAGVHEVTFEHPETAPIRYPDAADGLLTRETFPNPFASGRLTLTPQLFARGALVFEALASRRVTLSAAGGPSITVGFPGMPHFGLWTKPGAPFVCLEPWQGYAEIRGYEGAFAARPGMTSLAPGASRAFAVRIAVNA